tara:strand:- start:202 stop:375 length:174 start_codon:yes stop_codon:yes gene_type:complete
MKIKLILIFLLTSCSLNTENDKKLSSDLNFSDQLTIEEFKVKLQQYAINNKYPNIED